MSDHQNTVAIDLDGCLAEYDGWQGPAHIGAPYPGAVEVVRQWVERGWHVVIHTCRCTDDGTRRHSQYAQGWSVEQSVASIRAWLIKHDFPASVEIWTGGGKPFADLYIDDKAICIRPGSGPTWFACWLAEGGAPLPPNLAEHCQLALQRDAYEKRIQTLETQATARYEALKREFHAVANALKGDRLRAEVKALRQQRRVLADRVRMLEGRPDAALDGLLELPEKASATPPGTREPWQDLLGLRLAATVDGGAVVVGKEPAWPPSVRELLDGDEIIAVVVYDSKDREPLAFTTDTLDELRSALNSAEPGQPIILVWQRRDVLGAYSVHTGQWHLGSLSRKTVLPGQAFHGLYRGVERKGR